MINTSKFTCQSALNRKLTALFCFIFLLNALLTFSQQEQQANTDKKDQNAVKYRKNELKIGVLKLIFIPMLDVEYERVFNKYASFGGNIAVSFDGNESISEPTKFFISPFFRMYFTQTREYGSKGFFAQLSTGYYTGENQELFSFSTNTDKKFNSFGIGFAIGWKWINKGGFLVQITYGVVRPLSDTKVAPNFLFQGGIHLGYRF